MHLSICWYRAQEYICSDFETGSGGSAPAVLLLTKKMRQHSFINWQKTLCLTNAHGHVENQQFLNLTGGRTYTVTGNHICPFSTHPFIYKG